MTVVYCKVMNWMPMAIEMAGNIFKFGIREIFLGVPVSSGVMHEYEL